MMTPKRRISFGRWRRRPNYEDRYALHAYEEEVVMGVMAALPDATVGELMLAYPGRFRKTYLYRTLQRLHRQGKLKRKRNSGGGWSWGHMSFWRYSLSESPASATSRSRSRR